MLPFSLCCVAVVLPSESYEGHDRSRDTSASAELADGAHSSFFFSRAKRPSTSALSLCSVSRKECGVCVYVCVV